jgi:hypothetical protein
MRKQDLNFGSSFAEWKKSGKDIHSVIEDPLFVNPAAFDFHFKNLTVAKKIRFRPFDYSRSGVYGSEEWKKLAEFNPELSKKFDERVNTMESNYRNGKL